MIDLPAFSRRSPTMLDGRIIATKDLHRPEVVRRTEIISGLVNLNVIRQTGILDPGKTREPLFQAALTLTLINLNDLLQKAAEDGKRVSEVENVYPTGRENDLTALINAARNAACHMQSRQSDVDWAWARFCIVPGESNGISIKGNDLSCPFADDAAIFYGTLRLYLRRNVLHAHDLVTRIFS